MGYVIERVDGAGAVRYLTQYRDIKGAAALRGDALLAGQGVDAIRTAERGLEEGKIGDPRRGRQTLRRYVETEWFPNHMIEATTREGYRYILDRYVLPELGGMRMVAVLPGHVREWILRLQEVYGARASHHPALQGGPGLDLHDRAQRPDRVPPPGFHR